MSPKNESSTPSTAIFHEEQRFQQKPLWALMVLLFLIEVPFIVVPLFRIWVLGETVDGANRTDITPVFWGIFVIGLLSGLAWLLWNLRLVTDVQRDGVRVRMIPIQRRDRFYPFAKIRTFEAITYRPLRDYGGWGIRRNLKTKSRALNVSGNKGIMLQLTDETPLLIGTQHPDEFEAALRSVVIP